MKRVLSKKPAATRTLAVRLPSSFADQIESRAAARHVSVSTFIADTLRDRTRPDYPALAALSEIIVLAHALRLQPDNETVLRELQGMVDALCQAVRDELGA